MYLYNKTAQVQKIDALMYDNNNITNEISWVFLLSFFHYFFQRLYFVLGFFLNFFLFELFWYWNVLFIFFKKKLPMWRRYKIYEM